MGAAVGSTGVSGISLHRTFGCRIPDIPSQAARLLQHQDHGEMPSMPRTRHM